MEIPVVFAFDENYVVPAAATICSLLANSSKNEYYHIICLHRRVPQNKLNWLMKLHDKYGKCEFRFIDMQDVLSDAPTLGHITSTTYFRLLIPQLCPEYDKLIYADVDLIFRRGLSDALHENIGDNYLGGVLDIYIETESLKERGLNGSLYVNAGFLLLNNKKLIADDISAKWQAEIGKPHNFYLDQDILNRVCEGFIQRLPLCYNLFYHLERSREVLPSLFPENEIKSAFRSGTIHYVAAKPWSKKAFAFSNGWLWWKYYWLLPSGAEKQLLRHCGIFVCKLPGTGVFIVKQWIKWAIRKLGFGKQMEAWSTKKK